MKRRGEKADAGKKTKCEKSAGRPEGYVQTNLPISSVDASGLSGAVYLYNYPFSEISWHSRIFSPYWASSSPGGVGLDNFRHMLMLPDTARIFRNSFVIAVGKLVFTMVFSILFAILLNEINHIKFKKTIQTICFLPHFLSWVILATIFRNLLDTNGIANQLMMSSGLIKEPLMFLGSNKIFQGVIISTDVWKEFGYGAIIFIAALMGINPELYEAANVDGAGRLQKIWHVTLPGIRVTIVLVATLNIANILNAGFDQIYNLYSPIVYKSGDIIDTYVYRMSFINTQYSSLRR